MNQDLRLANWYMNKLGYFQFNESPVSKKPKFIAFIAGIFSIYLGLNILKITFLGSLPFFYLGYIIFLLIAH